MNLSKITKLISKADSHSVIGKNNIYLTFHSGEIYIKKTNPIYLNASKFIEDLSSEIDFDKPLPGNAVMVNVPIRKAIKIKSKSTINKESEIHNFIVVKDNMIASTCSDHIIFEKINFDKFLILHFDLLNILDLFPTDFVYMYEEGDKLVLQSKNIYARINTSDSFVPKVFVLIDSILDQFKKAGTIYQVNFNWPMFKRFLKPTDFIPVKFDINNEKCYAIFNDNNEIIETKFSMEKVDYIPSTINYISICNAKSDEQDYDFSIAYKNLSNIQSFYIYDMFTYIFSRVNLSN